MGIEANIDMRSIRDYLHREVERNVYRVVASLQKVGEQVVNEIRTSHISNWTDQTGNLRSSIGYVIAIDGVPLNMSAFEKVDGPKRHETNVDGSEEGRRYIQSLASLYPKGIALIVVAGMEYASYVEAMESRTVLAQGELLAKQLVATMIQKLSTLK